MGVNIRRSDSVEAITNAYKNAWMAFCDEETRTRQQAEDVNRQVSVASLYFTEHLFTCLYQAEERGRAGERAKYEADHRQLEAWDH
jgi:hypothetical protein